MPEGFQVGPATPAPFAINIHSAPDVAASLPPNAADKLRALRDRVADLHRLSLSLRIDVWPVRRGLPPSKD